MRRGFGVATGCLVGALVAMSCDSEDSPTVLPVEDAVDAFIEAWCERLVDCDCPTEQVPTQEDCRYEVDARIDGLRQVGDDAGLEWDGACLGATLDRLDDRGCDADDDERDDDGACTRPCNAYHGTRGIGEPCEQAGAFSDCAQGLYCSGTCRDPCERAGIGDSCDEQQCVDGAICDYSEGQPRCVRLPDAAGEACLQGSCGGDLFCVFDPVDPTIQTCAAPAALGEACMGHVQCESEYCPAGYCTNKPGKGEDCFGICAAGLDCDYETSTCTKGDPAVCSEHPL